MSILIKSAQIIDERSPLHQKKKNIFISDSGVIKHIGAKTPEASRVIEGKNIMVSMGWLDMQANFNDPGMEYKEDLNSGKKAAEAGGFTGVVLVPNTDPCIESKNDVSYLLSGNQNSVTRIYPMGAVTKSCKGEDLTEMLDMCHAGAVAYSDGEMPIWNTDILLKTLLYLQKFKGLLINRPEDKYLTAFGTMNEGTVSTMLGMKGMPNIAEEIMIRRDIELLAYAGGRLHVSNISSAESVKLIKAAKKRGLDITCNVAVYNLIWSDEKVGNYDSNYKVNPPLRENSDIKALDKGLEEGVIDVIVSAHTPQDEENKKLEFDHAAFGMTGLQTFMPLLIQKYGKNGFLKLIDKFTTNPRTILGLDLPEIKENEKAELTVFDPDAEWTYSMDNNFSKSTNSPLLGERLKGKVLATISNGRSYVNSTI
jgi:dihydroorotase